MDKPDLIDEFSKIEVKVGTVRTAERVPDTDNCYDSPSTSTRRKGRVR